MAFVRFANYLSLPPLMVEVRKHVYSILFVCLVTFLGEGQAAIAQGTAPDVGVRFQPPTAVLLTNATIVVSSDRTLAVADLLIREGKIAAVGVDLPAPPDAEVIDCTGKTLYPAFIDAFVEFPSTADTSPTANWNSHIQPQRVLSQQLKPDVGKLEGLRKAGVGIALAAPDNGIIKGQSCVITTSPKPLAQSLLHATAFQHMRLLPERRSRDGYPVSPMGAVALLRQTLLDANWYQQAQQAYETNSAIQAPETNAALAALAPTIRARQAVLIDAPNELYALRADRLAKEHSLKIVLRGSGREYRQLESIANLRRTFILPVNFPKPPDVSSATAALDASLQSLMHWHLAPENPGRLEKAGVEFVLTTDTLNSPADLLPNVSKAIKRGLSERAALEALTLRPAKLLEVDHLAGTLEIGKLANILVTDGPLFAESTKIQETWVAGNRDNWNEEPEIDLRGTWKLALVDKSVVQELELKLSGSRKKLKGELGLVGAFVKQQDEPAAKPESKPDDVADAGGEKKGQAAAATESPDEQTAVKDAEQPATKSVSETEKETGKKSAVEAPAKTELKQLEFNGYRLTANFKAAVFKESLQGVAYLSAVVTEQRTVAEFSGSLQWPDGTTTAYTATLPAGDKTTESTEKSEDGPGKSNGKKKAEPSDERFACEVNFPLGAYGVTELPNQAERVLIRGATLWTCADGGLIESGDLLIHLGYIEEIGKRIAAPEGAVVIDGQGMHITPGIIDCHSHMATDGGINEGSQAVTSEVRIADFIDPTDMTIYRQLAGGVTAANILHGSANPIGGQNQVIKLRWGATDEGMKMIEAPAGIKFALGENVKRASSEESATSRYPFSRMGVEQIIQDRFEAARLYRNKQQLWASNPVGLPPRRDLELDAIAEILEGTRWIHCHSYRQDEILTFLRTLEAYGVTVGSLQHILEGYKVADAMARHGATGSTFSDWWAYKMEVQDAIPFNGAIMHRAGVIVSFNSDDGELARHLNHEAAKAVKYGGVTAEEALKFVTLNPAKQLRVDAYVGSLESGKQADFVIWNGPPLSTLSVCMQTWIDGRKYFDRQQDLERRVADAQLHRRLVQRALDSGEKMSDQSQDAKDPSTWWLRYDEFCTSRK